MTFVDMAILFALLISGVVGFFRGFLREAVSLLTLLVAAWAALHFAPLGGSLVENLTGLAIFRDSDALRLWAGRALIFFVILVFGGLIGWGVSKLVARSVISGPDRVFGMGFGLVRGALLLGVAALAASYLGFAGDRWWIESRLVPYAERVGAVIKVMAPQALEYLRQPPGDGGAGDDVADNGTS